MGKSIILITVLLQIAGPYIFGFGNWCNVLQYLGGYGIPFALLAFYRHHKREIERLENRLFHNDRKQGYHAPK